MAAKGRGFSPARCPVSDAEAVDRNFQVDLTVIFRRRQVSPSYIDLQRGQDQAGGAKGGVTCLAHLNEGIFADPFMDMNIRRALLGDRGFPGRMVASGGQVVMADKDAGFRRQVEDAVDRAVERA